MVFLFLLITGCPIHRCSWKIHNAETHHLGGVYHLRVFHVHSYWPPVILDKHTGLLIWISRSKTHSQGLCICNTSLTLFSLTSHLLCMHCSLSCLWPIVAYVSGQDWLQSYKAIGLHWPVDRDLVESDVKWTANQQGGSFQTILILNKSQTLSLYIYMQYILIWHLSAGNVWQWTL